MKLLIQYKGGGYDGCHWEWNYAYLDDLSGEVTFSDIVSTGWNGCRTLNELKEWMRETCGGERVLRKPSHYLYNLEKDGQWDEFVKESNAGHVIAVARYLTDEISLSLEVRCFGCNESMLPSEAILSGAEGAGGIAIQYTAYHCAHCSCNMCGEWWEGMEKDPENGFCEYCLQENRITA